MTPSVIEIFVEESCATCARVVGEVTAFVRGTDVTLHIIRREGSPELFRERNITICPATCVNGRLMFYGDVSREDIARHVFGRASSHTSHPTPLTKGTTTMNSSLSRSVIAGVIATVAMTAVMLMAPLMGMPEMNIGRMLGAFMGVPAIVGWVGHFMIGTVLAIGYGQIFASRLPGPGLVRGILYGMLPWLMSQVVVNPMMGAGVFAANTPAPALMVMGSLLGHIVYGAVLGLVYARRG